MNTAIRLFLIQHSVKKKNIKKPAWTVFVFTIHAALLSEVVSFNCWKTLAEKEMASA